MRDRHEKRYSIEAQGPTKLSGGGPPGPPVSANPARHLVKAPQWRGSATRPARFSQSGPPPYQGASVAGVSHPARPQPPSPRPWLPLQVGGEGGTFSRVRLRKLGCVMARLCSTGACRLRCCRASASDAASASAARRSRGLWLSTTCPRFPRRSDSPAPVRLRPQMPEHPPILASLSTPPPRGCRR